MTVCLFNRVLEWAQFAKMARLSSASSSKDPQGWPIESRRQPEIWHGLLGAATGYGGAATRVPVAGRLQEVDKIVYKSTYRWLLNLRTM